MDIQIKKTDGQYLLFPQISHVENVDLESKWFDIEYWRQLKRVSGFAKGRYVTWFVKSPVQDKTWVLRHYYRGGKIAKITKDQFVYTGLENTRCYQEIDLLQHMIRLNLPVPKPIAARVVRKGLCYKADLLMEKIEAVNVVGQLKEGIILQDGWFNIGTMIAKFHQNGIEHTDLNAHNILYKSPNEMWLIDFDNCSMRDPKPSWQKRNLDRLKRSFIKEKGLHEAFHFSEVAWSELMEGYTAQMS